MAMVLNLRPPLKRRAVLLLEPDLPDLIQTVIASVNRAVRTQSDSRSREEIITIQRTEIAGVRFKR